MDRLPLRVIPNLIPSRIIFRVHPECDPIDPDLSFDGGRFFELAVFRKEDFRFDCIRVWRGIDRDDPYAVRLACCSFSSAAKFEEKSSEKTVVSRLKRIMILPVIGFCVLQFFFFLSIDKYVD